MLVVRTAFVVAVAACSKPPPAAPVGVKQEEDPKVKCARVAETLLAAYTKGHEAAPHETLAAAFRELVVERCTQDVWSIAAQDCLLAPGADIDACTAKLTPPQQQSFQEAAQKRLSEISAQQDEKK